MPHPSHRLDLQLVPSGPDAVERVRRAMAALIEAGILDGQGWAGPRAERLVTGGFVRIRADIAPRPRLWANQQGGFRATCPSCGQTVVRALHAALERAADGLECQRCGWAGGIERVIFRPPAAYGVAALVVHDAADALPTDEGRALLDRELGEWALVWRRP